MNPHTRYRLVLEEVTGPDDDEQIEMKSTWDILGVVNAWDVDQDLLDSIQEALDEALESAKED